MNFSEWRSLATERQQKRLQETCSEVPEGEMPGKAYLLMHPRAKLTSAEVQSICRWTRTVGQAVSVEGKGD